MLTFFGGPRSCIGYRFALVEYVHLCSWIVCISNADAPFFFQDEGFIVQSYQGIRIRIGCTT